MRRSKSAEVDPQHRGDVKKDSKATNKVARRDEARRVADPP
jgi:hypothetical protein